MYPVLVEIGFFKIFTYGLFVATGFFIAILLAANQAQKAGLDQQKILDLCFYVLVSAIIGARVLYVVVEYRHFLERPVEVFMFWKGGLVFYGGLIAAVGVSVWFLNKRRMPLWKVGDTVAPSIAIGQAIGRWGCFFAGCCYGVRTDVPWGVTFTDPRSLAPLNVSLHPTQIYLSLNALLIFSFLVWLRKRKSFEGQVFWAYGILYSIGRFIIEYYRGDDRGYAVQGVLSTSQFIGIFTLVFSLAMYFRLRSKRLSTIGGRP
ncbi:MAG: prolipoprotein diacylglyceryl transferase [Nitrospinae bacterium]|nr:prolipoprotein diacylglyceryl transferase [Nitrospinota bacterium]